MRQLQPMDAFMYYLESPRTPFHISALTVHEPSPAGPVGIEQVIDLMNQRLHLAPTFRQRLVTVPLGLDHPYWVDDEHFDIEHHVRHIGLPRPGDWNQLRTLVARLHAHSLDMTRPPWELYLIDGLDGFDRVATGGFAVLLKVHHAAIDGVAGAEMISAILDHRPQARCAPPIEPWSPRGGPSPVRRLAGAAVHVATRPPHLVSRATSVAGMSANLLRRKFRMPAVTVPRTRFNGSVSAHRVFDIRSWELAELKQIRGLTPGSTVNDVVLAVIAGALRRYLSHHDELPEDSLRAVVPVSVRTKSADADQASIVGNEIVTMAVRLHTEEPDDVARFAAICASTRESKARKQAIGARTLTDLAAALPGRLLGLGFRAGTLFVSAAGTQMLYNTMVTNVPGSPVPLYFCGARAVDVYGLGPLQDSMGLMHIVGSYDGQIGIFITADRAMLPDIDRYLDCVEASYQALLAAVETITPHADLLSIEAE